MFYGQFLERLKSTLVSTEQQNLLDQCVVRLNGLVTSMNSSLCREDSHQRLIELSTKLGSSQIPHCFAILDQSRILCLEDDVKLTSTDEVTYFGMAEI